MTFKFCVSASTIYGRKYDALIINIFKYLTLIKIKVAFSFKYFFFKRLIVKARKVFNVFNRLRSKYDKITRQEKILWLKNYK